MTVTGGLLMLTTWDRRTNSSLRSRGPRHRASLPSMGVGIKGRPSRPDLLRLSLFLVVLVVCLTHVSAAAEATKSSSSSALCNKFPDYCDGSEVQAGDKKGGGGGKPHQRFVETKWRKAKGDSEIRGHLASKRPVRVTENDLDEAELMRAATIREAEEKLRLTEGAGAAARAERTRLQVAVDSRRTVQEARRKAHLIEEVRRRRRQRLEKLDEEEDEDDDEMEVEVEDEDDETEEDEEDDSAEDEVTSEELLREETEDDEDAEDRDEEEVEDSEEEYVVEQDEDEEEDPEEEESEEQPEDSDEADEELEDEDELAARKKLREIMERRQKWKEEQARMKQREEERKRAEEERRKSEEQVRRRRIEELRKKKREELEREEEQEEERQKAEVREREEQEELERQRLAEERKKQEVEEEERRKEDQRRKEAEHERIRKQAEEEEKRRKDEEHRVKKVAEEEEKRRKDEEQRVKKAAEEEENRNKELEKIRKHAEEEEKRREAEQERIRKEAAVEEEGKRKRAEDDRKRKQAAEEEEKRIKDEQERLRKQVEERKKQEEERERKRKAEEEKIKRQAEVREAKRRQEEEKKEREAAEERLKKLEEAKEAKRRQDEEEKEKKEAEEARVKKIAEEKLKKDATKARKVSGDEEPKKMTDKSPIDTPPAAPRPSISRVSVDDPLDGPDQPDAPWMSGFPEFFAATADDDVKNELCQKHSRIFVQHLYKYKIWALNMYDATAKFPSGILSGNTIQLGDFDQCLSVDVRLRQRSASPGKAGRGSAGPGGESGMLARAVSWVSGMVLPVLEPVLGPRDDGLVNIRGRYCLANMDLDLLTSRVRSKDQDAALRVALDRALAHSFVKGSLNDTAHFVPRFRTLGWGLCVPSTCGPRDVEAALRGAVARFQQSGAWGAGVVRARLSVGPGACRDAPQGPAHQRLPPASLLVCAAGALLLALAVIATMKDTGEEPDELGGAAGMLASFSLKRCWSALTALEDPGADDIRCIHGVRVACSVLLYLAHKLVPLAALPFSNRARLAELAASPASLLLRASFVYTDTFLLLSGVLASFHLSRHLGRGGALQWPGRIATRFLRLTPTLAVVLLFYAHVLELLGSGPLWGQLVEENARLCRQSLWRNLLYVQNFWPFQQMCAPHTHQLALDMQLFALVPPLVWLLDRAWPLASPLLVLLVGGSTWLRHRAALQHRVSLLIYSGIRPADLYRAADTTYTQAPHRASAYLIGVALGYLLHRLPRKLPVPRLGRLLGWLLSAALGGWALFGQRHVARFDYRLDVQEAARYSALAPLAWAAAVAWLIFACYTGNGGRLDSVLCARPLVFISRISYAFYLTQFLVFFYNAGSVRSQREFSILSSLDLWELLFVLVVSVMVTVLVDLPMQSVRTAFSGSKRRHSLKWDPPTPSPHELAAVYYYGGTDVYTAHSKED